MASIQTPTKKRERGEGPVSFAFIDSKGQEHKRVPATVHAIVVKDRVTGKNKSYDPSRFPPQALVAIAAYGFAKRAQNYVASNNKNGKDVHMLADSVYADFIEGRLYNKSEGEGSRQRKFDATPLVTALARYSADQAKNKIINRDTGKPVVAMTEEHQQRLIAKLQSMPFKQRTQLINGKYLANNTVNKYYLEAKAKAKQTSKEDLAQTFDL